jgi:hypothetical protein
LFVAGLLAILSLKQNKSDGREKGSLIPRKFAANGEKGTQKACPE